MCYGFDGDTALRESLEKRGATRRGLLRGAAATVAGTALVGTGALPATAGARYNRWKRVPPGKISIQLYTLRDIMVDDGVDRTLRTLGRIGYPRVELAGYYGRTAREMKAALRCAGLRASSSHEGISPDAGAMHTKFQNAVSLGQRYVNVPYLNSDSLADWQMWADQMNAEAAVAKRYGLAYGYHNHAHEFTTVLEDGSTPWQVFTERLDPRLVHLEADLYWVVTGGLNSGDGVEDPEQFAIDTIAAAPQKVRQYHVKDKQYAQPNSDGDHVDLGTGFIEFDRIFAEHAVEEYIVENDTPDVTPIQTARVGYRYLRQLRF